MSKNFKIARKPGQSLGAASDTLKEPKEPPGRSAKTAAANSEVIQRGTGQTTRKTIEVPEDYFFQVKMRALERKMLEKELWAEILGEYFNNHPAAKR